MHPKKQGIESDSVRAFKKITKMITPSHSTRIKLHTAARRIQMARPFTAHLEQVTQLSSFLKLNKARHLENDATAHLQQTPQLLSLLKQNKLEDTMKTAILVKALDSSNINTIAHQKAIKMLLKYNTPITDAVLYKAGAIGDLSLIDQLYSANNDPSAGLEGAACGGRVKALQFFLTQCHLRQVVVPIEQVLVKSVEMDMLVSVHLLLAHQIHARAVECAMHATCDSTKLEIVFALVEAGATKWNTYRFTCDNVLYLHGTCKVARQLFAENNPLYEMWISEWERGAMAILIEFCPEREKFAFPTVLAQLILQFVDEPPRYCKMKKQKCRG